jgi:hypothetical protein
MSNALSITPPIVVSSSTDKRRAAGKRGVSERRNRLRLRELCDEVLASYRVASERDLFDDADRREGYALLTRSVSRAG